MITLLAALILQAHAVKPDPDHETCYYYRRGDYTRAEAKRALETDHIRMPLDKFCKITPDDRPWIEEQQQCHQVGCPDFRIPDRAKIKTEHDAQKIIDQMKKAPRQK